MTIDYGVYEYRNDFDEVRWQPYVGEERFYALSGYGSTRKRWARREHIHSSWTVEPVLYRSRRRALKRARRRSSLERKHDWRIV